jgi:hypothetical protein
VGKYSILCCDIKEAEDIATTYSEATRSTHSRSADCTSDRVFQHMANRNGNCTWRVVSKLAPNAASEIASSPGTVDDTLGRGAHAITGALDDAAHPMVDAISGTFLASECTSGASSAYNGEYGQFSKSGKAAKEEAQR